MSIIAGNFRATLSKAASRLAFITGLATMIGLIAALLSSHEQNINGNYQWERSQLIDRFIVRSDGRAQDTEAKLKELEASNRAIQEAIESVRHSGKPVKFAVLDPADRQRIDQIGSTQSKLNERLSALESALMTSPEKAVAVPMLKQEVDSLQDRTHSDLDAIRGEIGRLFTLTQWFIGLMFTIALGMFGLSFNLRKASAPAAGDEKP
jgi:hypothetical protein